MPLQATSGAASYDAFGGGVPVVPAYIEEAFSCFLYTGNGSTQTITNGIDLSTKGGLAWLKMRNFNQGHILFDTIRGVENYLQSASSDEQYNLANSLTAFNTTGFSVGSGASTNAEPYVSWSFRKQPKFFDMVSWTGSGSNRTIAHSLGSVPACIMVKRTDVAANWQVYHRSLANTEYLVLNSIAAKATGATRWNSTTPTSTVFSIGTDDTVNASGGTYVAYIFAHNAGGFGLSGTDNVISCGSGSWSGGADNVVNLGYEAQWVMYKRTDDVGNWMMWDTMRGMSLTASEYLRANLSDAAGTFNSPYAIYPTATGFTVPAGAVSTGTYIYIAIRRGPMKVPTSGTSVFSPVAYTGNGTSQSITTGITGDLTYIKYRTDGGAATFWFDRLRNPKAYLESNSTAAEVTGTQHITAFNQLGFSVGNNGNVNDSGGTFISQTFRRAPSFFDEVCYTGTGSDTTQTHNLGVAPELVIIKSRSNAIVWVVGNTAIGFSNYLLLNATDASASGSNVFNSTAPTSTVFSIGAGSGTNQSGATYVAYLFATLAGVSKVGSYTGTATTKQIDCGFTGGARFVLIKRTDSTGDWYVWDSARGIVSGNDSYLLLNSTAAEVTNTDYVDTYSAGFEISSTAPAAINANGGTFIFLAIA